MKIIGFYILLLFATLSCKKNKVVPNVDHSSKYYPLAIGYTWIYAVDSIILYGNETQNADTLRYQVKNRIVSTTNDATGTLNYVVEKSVQTAKSNRFVFNNLFTLQKTTLELVCNAQDARIPMLIFPIIRLKEWSGNVYTQKDEWNMATGNTNEVECMYTEVHVPHTANGVVYDSTSTVTRLKEENAINSRYATEVYAANLGLVSKYFENIENHNRSAPKGSKYTYTLLSFEKN